MLKREVIILFENSITNEIKINQLILESTINFNRNAEIGLKT